MTSRWRRVDGCTCGPDWRESAHKEGCPVGIFRAPLREMTDAEVWEDLRAVPGWEEEAEQAHAEIAAGKGISLIELRKRHAATSTEQRESPE